MPVKVPTTTEKSFAEKAQSVGLTALTPEELQAQMGDPKVPYLSAAVSFLNRDTQDIRKAMMFPITQIVLHQQMNAQNPEGKPWRVFVVGDGQWVEQS